MRWGKQAGASVRATSTSTISPLAPDGYARPSTGPMSRSTASRQAVMFVQAGTTVMSVRSPALATQY